MRLSANGVKSCRKKDVNDIQSWLSVMVISSFTWQVSISRLLFFQLSSG